MGKRERQPALAKSAVKFLGELLKQRRFKFSREADLHEGVRLYLSDLGIRADHEKYLGEFGTVDFYFPYSKVALEIKAKGAPSSVARQLFRYAQSDLVRGLILLTSKSNLARLPAVINGKPFLAVSLWETMI